MVRPVAIGTVGQAHRGMPDLGDHGVDDIEYGRCRAEAGVDRQVAKLERAVVAVVGFILGIAK